MLEGKGTATVNEDGFPFADVEQPDLLLFAESGVVHDSVANPAPHTTPGFANVSG